MKTQTFGESTVCYVNAFDAHSRPSPPYQAAIILLGHPPRTKENNCTTKYLSEAYDDYQANRSNGSSQDNPDYAIPLDGTPSLSMKNDGYYYVKYIEGEKDREWMERRDRNYIFRLEREGLLDEVEPNLRTEVPKLYEKVMAFREENKKEYHPNCASSRPS